MSVELAFKEIMKLLLSNNLNEYTYKSFKSVYFEYYHSKKTIRLKKSFKLKHYFISSLTRQFKKGIYEIFLHEYHRVTKKGLDERFDRIRRFVRKDIADIPLHFLDNNGIHMVETDLNNYSLKFPENSIAQINDFGFYTMMIYSNVFFLEVTPRADLTRDIFLPQESRKFINNRTIFNELKTLKYITDIDFTLRKLYGQN